MPPYMIDKTEHTQKPDKSEMPKIISRMKETSNTIAELAQYVIKGYSFRPAVLSGTKSDTFICQQIFGLDFDGTCTFEEAIKICKKNDISPCLAYETFSSSEDVQKFRIVFCLNDVISEAVLRNSVQKAIMAPFETLIDIHCSDATRIFFGGRKILLLDEDATVSSMAIMLLISNFGINELKKPDRYKKPSKKKVTKAESDESPVAECTTECTDKVDAIKNLDVASLKKLLGFVSESSNNNFGENENKKLVMTHEEIMGKIKKINLYEFLGVDIGKFNCVLPDHCDTKPSANIFVTDDGTQIYKCHGCGKSLGIINLVCELASCNKEQAIRFINEVYGITTAEEEEKKNIQRQQIHNLIECFCMRDFNVKYPELSRFLGRGVRIINEILKVVADMPNYLIINGKVSFYISTSKFEEKLNVKNRKGILQNITKLCLIGILKKLGNEELGKKLCCEAYKHRTRGNKRTNYYSIIETDINALESAAKNLNAHKLRSSGLTRKCINAVFGMGCADTIYPQHVKENHNEQFDEFKAIKEFVDLDIEAHGFALQSEIVKHIPDYLNRDMSNKEAYVKAAVFFNIIASLPEYIVTRTNKAMNSKYNLKAGAYVGIILPAELN